MAFEADPKAPWRSTMFSAIPVKYVTIPDSVREYEPVLPADDVPAGVDGVRDWLASTDDWTPARGETRVGLSSGRMIGMYEVGNVAEVSALGSEYVIESVLDYEYFKKQTRLHATTDGYHYRAAPDLNAAAVNSMLSSQSVEEYAKTAGLKLPRITASDSNQTPDPLGTAPEEGGMLVNRFEALRGLVGEHASQDDYGYRLHSLARVVLHAIVVKEAARRNGKRDAMEERTFMRSVLTAALPMVRPNQLRDSSWWYVGSELSPLYRAFMIMGARGLHHYSTVDTVYAGMVSEPEVSMLATTPIVFTRKTGQMRDDEVAPHVDDYLRVLDNPELALSYYNAYAQSIGLVHEAAEIMLQTAVGPFVWGEVATMPYRASSPKMDGAAYLLTENTAKAHLNILTAESIVGRAALLGKGYLVGAAALLGSFKRTSRTLTADVLARTVGALSDGVQARTLGAEIWSHMSGATASMEWVHPFDDVQVGVARAMAAFRSAGWLLAWYKAVPAVAMDGVFDRGIPMSGAIVGEGDYRGDHYKELLIFQLAQGKPLQLMSESYSQAVLTPMEYQAMGAMKAWHAVCRPLQFISREFDTPAALPKSKRREEAEQRVSMGEEEISASLQFLQAIPDTDSGSVGGTTIKVARRDRQGGGKPPEQVSPQSTRSVGSKPSQAPSSSSGHKRSSPSQASLSVNGKGL